MYVAYETIFNAKKTLVEKSKSLFKTSNVVVVDTFSNMAHNESTSVDELIKVMNNRQYLFENAEKEMIKKTTAGKDKVSEKDVSCISNKLELERQVEVNERISKLIRK